MLDVNGAELFVDEVGGGPVALVLHGGLGRTQQLSPARAPWASVLRLFSLDPRGNARSNRPDPSTLTMVQWADDAAHVAAVVGAGAPVIVIGHSFGGFIAQE